MDENHDDSSRIKSTSSITVTEDGWKRYRFGIAPAADVRQLVGALRVATYPAIQLPSSFTRAKNLARDPQRRA